MRVALLKGLNVVVTMGSINDALGTNRVTPTGETEIRYDLILVSYTRVLRHLTEAGLAHIDRDWARLLTFYL
jgi:hypothetical protein